AAARPGDLGLRAAPWAGRLRAVVAARGAEPLAGGAAAELGAGEPGVLAATLAAPAALRAAARRGLERCGRVRGSLPRTPPSSGGAGAGRSPSLASLMGTSLLNAGRRRTSSRATISPIFGGDALA